MILQLFYMDIVAERVKAPFLRQLCYHDRVILAQLPSSSRCCVLG